MKLTLNLSAVAKDELDKMAERTNKPMIDVIKSAFALFDLISTEQASGGRIIIEDANGKQEVLPSMIK